jgi:hypothetical protein
MKWQVPFPTFDASLLTRVSAYEWFVEFASEDLTCQGDEAEPGR